MGSYAFANGKGKMKLKSCGRSLKKNSDPDNDIIDSSS